MAFSFEQIISIVIALFITFIAWKTHEARFKACIELSQQYASKPGMLLLFFVITSLLQYGSVGVLILISSNLINVYGVFYLFVPLFLEGNRIILKNQKLYEGYFSLIKGVYYAIMIGVSIAQLIFNYSDPVNLLLGVSIAISIFDGIDAIESGVSNITESSR